MTVSDYIANRLPDMRRVCNNIAFKFHMDQSDHFQNCIVNAIRLQKTYVHESDTKFFSWWGRLCHNQAINVYRIAKKVPPMVDAQFASNIPGAASRIDDRQLLASVYRRIRRYSPKGTRTKWALVMYLTAQGYSYQDAADELGIPVGTVRSTIHRCRKFLTTKPATMTENEAFNSDNPVKRPNPATDFIPGFKKCHSKCGEQKALSEFSRNKNSKDGYNNVCKKCQAAYMKEYNARKVNLPNEKVPTQSGKADPVEEKVNLPHSEPVNLTREERLHLLRMLIEKSALIDRIIQKLK